MQRELSQQDGAGLIQAGDDRCVVTRHPVLQKARVGGRTNAVRGKEVLHRDRDPVQRTQVIATLESGIGSSSLLKRMFSGYRYEAMQAAVQRCGTVEARLHELD